MSKSIKQLIEDAAAITKKRAEDEQDYLKRLVGAIAEVDDAKWKGLGADAQEWFNNGVEAMNEGKKTIGFPDEAAAAPARVRAAAKAVPVQEEAAGGEDVVGAEVRVTSARGKVIEGVIIEIDENSMVVKDADGTEHEFDRSRTKSVEFMHADAPAGEATDRAPEVGDMVDAVTKRGKELSGEVIEVDGDTLVLKIGDEEVEVDMATAQSIVIQGGGEPAAGADEGSDPAVGDNVEAVTKRGKTVKGEVIEIDGDTLVIKDGDDEVEVDMSTAQSIKVLAAKKPAGRATATAPAPARGRSTAQTKDQPSGEGEKKSKITAADNGGVSVTTRMYEIICEEPTITIEAMTKKLKAEKLTFNDKTLAINYKMVNKIVELLKKYKHFK